MRRLLVRGRRLVVAVDLHQHHMARVGLVLDHVEPQHPGLAQRRPRVDQRRGQEVPGPARPDPDVNVNDQHVPIFPLSIRRRSHYGHQRGCDHFEERELEARVPDLAAGGAWTRVRLRWRKDPLTGASARILTGEKLQPPGRPDLTALTAPPAFCPFDSDRLETATFRFPPSSPPRAASARAGP